MYLTKVCNHILKPNTQVWFLGENGSKERQRDTNSEWFDLGIIEDTHHIIMQCPYLQCIGREMYNEIKSLEIEEYSISKIYRPCRKM